MLKERIEAYVAALQEAINAHYTESFPNLTPDTVTVSYGRNYAKIIKKGNQQSVHSFVALKDISTKSIQAKEGDILKAATWNAPARHARGSVLNDDILKGVDVYGASYLM